MKVLKSAALVAAALLGAMALAAPASADPPPFTADASCGADGTWQVRWYYYNIEGGLPERYDPLGTTITTDPPGTKLELTGDIATRTVEVRSSANEVMSTCSRRRLPKATAVRSAS